MRRGLMIGCFGLLGLCVVCGVLGFFFGLPRFRDELRDGVADFGATEIAEIFAIPGSPVPGATGPGTYVLTEADINARIQEENPNAQNIDDWLINLTPEGYRVGFTASGDEVSYSGNLIAENGRLKVTNAEADASFFEWFFSAGAMGGAVERSVNTWLTANNLTLTDVQLADGEVTLVTE
jgi:hypothetical protein